MYRVIVVEDEASARERYVDYITASDLGFHVVGAFDRARDALAAAGELHPDVAFVDIWMPGETGLWLIHQLRASGWHGEAVMVSGFGEFDYAQTAIREGVFDYLLKPVFPEDMKALLERMAERLSSAVPAPSEEDTSRLPAHVRKAVDYLRRNYGETVTLSAAAAHANVAATYLSSLFTRHCGMSFHEYLHHIRADAASQLLRGTDLSIATIAERVGFTDVSSFSRMYRRVTGVPPGRYRSGRP